MARTAALAVLLALLAPLPAIAQEKPGRYAMTPTEGGFLRLDTQTGAVAYCSRRDADWTCAPAADDAQRLREENDKLRNRTAELEAEVKRQDELLGLRDKEGKSAERPGGPGMQLPTEQDVDKAMDYVTRMLRKFREKLKELEDPEKKGTKI